MAGRWGRVQSTASLANARRPNFDLGRAGHGDVGQTVAMYYADQRRRDDLPS
jgi:hypothetical protein